MTANRTFNRTFNHNLTLVLVALSSLSLAGCKGGGGGNPTTAATPPASTTSTPVTQTAEPVQPPTVTPEETPVVSSDTVIIPANPVPALPIDTVGDEEKPVPATLWEDDSAVKILSLETYTFEQAVPRGQLLYQSMLDVTATPAAIPENRRLYLTSLSKVGLVDYLLDKGGVLILDAETLSPLGNFTLNEKILSLAASADHVYTLERFLPKISAYDVVDPTSPVLLGTVPTDTTSTLVTSSDGTLFFNSKNDLNRLVSNEANSPATETVATLNSLALGQVINLAVQDTAMYSVHRELTPGVPQTFRVPEEDMKYYQRWIWPREESYKAIQALPPGHISLDARAQYAALGADITTAPFDRDDLFLAQVLERDKLPLNTLQLMFSSSYLEKSLVDSVRITDLEQGNNAIELVRKPGKIIQQVSAHDHRLEITLIDNLAANEVDTLEVYDTTTPLSPQLQHAFSKASYPTLVSDHTVFSTFDTTPVAYSLRKMQVSGKDRYQLRVYDLTTIEPVMVIGQVTLPQNVVATSLTVEGDRVFIGTEKQQIYGVNVRENLE